VEVRIYKEYDMLVHEFQKNFPSEANQIRRFFDYIAKTSSIQLYVDLKYLTFAELLDTYFKSTELKSLFSMFLGNMALPSRRASAFAAAFLYREFILDGGYYPRGGMQRFADVLVERLSEYGGRLLFLTTAVSIELKNDEVIGVIIKNNVEKTELKILTRCVVATCDPHQLVNKLLNNQGHGHALKEVNTYINNEVSLSAFMIHLGINKDIRTMAKYDCNVWYYPGHHIDDYYEALLNGNMGLEKGFLFYSIPSFHDSALLPTGKHCLQVILVAPFKPRPFWEKDNLKDAIADEIIRRIENFIPNLSQYIEIKQIAIPPTLVKYTWNYNGAMYGWASTPMQIGYSDFGERLGIKGLFITGHWSAISTGHSGISTVVASGRKVAKVIMKRLTMREVPAY
jgi:phytoene dehydrogenase-like protein